MAFLNHAPMSSGPVQASRAARFRTYGVVHLVTALLVAIGAPTSVSAAELTVRQVSSPVSNPSDPVAWDVDGDGIAEVLIAGQSGEFALVDGRTLKARWQVRLGERGLLSPAVGVFGGRPGIAVVSQDGVIRILEFWDGSLRTRVETGQPTQVPPAIASVGDGNDSIVTAHDDGSVRLSRIKDGNLSQIWVAPNEHRIPGRGGVLSVGRLSRSPAVGDLDGDGRPEIAIGSGGGVVQVIPLDQPEQRVLVTLPQNTSVVSNAVVATLDGERPQAIFACNTGLAYAFTYHPGENGSPGRLVENANLNVNGESVGHSLAVPSGGDKFGQLIVGTIHQVAYYDGGTRYLSVGKPLGSTSPPLSPPTVLWSGGRALTFVVDARGDGFLFHPEDTKSSDPIRGATGLKGIGVVGNFDGSGTAQVLYVDRSDSVIRVVSLGVPLDSDKLSTISPGGSFFRNGHLSGAARDALAAIQAQTEQLAVATAKEAITARDAGHHQGSLELARIALWLRPNLQEVQNLAGPVVAAGTFRKWLIYSAIFVVVVGPVVGFFGLRIYRKARKRARLRQARVSLSEGRVDEALQALGSDVPAVVEESSVFITYADIYTNMDSPPAEALPVLIQALEKDPSNRRIQAALARCYAHVEPTTDEALIAYATALDGEGSMAGSRLCLTAGRAAIARKLPADKVIRWLQMAACGPEEYEAKDQLALYLSHQGIYSDRYLPLVEEAARRHSQDKEYWIGVVRAYHSLKRLDDQARRAASHLLELLPGSTDGKRLLGHCLYQAGDLHRALQTVSSAMPECASDEDLVVLQARILGALRRTDKETVAVCRRALELRGSDGALEVAYIRALVVGQGVQDLSETDYVRLQRVAKSAGEDPDIQQGLAEAARSRGDQVTLIGALDQLRKLGRGGPGILKEMARALAKGEIADQSAETLLREALQVMPDDREILEILAGTLTALKRTDAESLAWIRKSQTLGCASRDAVIHLITALLDQGLHGDALIACASARSDFGGDPELDRLEGQATLAADRIEDGIRILEALVSRNPGDNAALLALADAYSRQRVQTNEARLVLEKACESGEEKPLIRLALARCEASGGDFARAIPNMKKAAQDPELALVVRDEVTALVAQNPTQPQLRWFLTTLLIEQGRLSEAVAQLEKIRDIDPTQHKLVASSVDRILTKDPNHLGATVLKGRLQFAVGGLEAARKTLDSAAQKAPGNPEVLGALVEILQESVQSGNDPSARIALGRVLMQQEKWDNATEVLQVAAQDYRVEVEAGRLLGECYMRQGLLDYALQHLRKQPSGPQLHDLILELGTVFEEASDMEGAKQAYKHCLVVDPNSRQAMKRLQALAGITRDPLADSVQPATAKNSISDSDRYEMVEELGRGAMGIVYKALDRELDEMVALKILPDNLNENDRALTRFRTEARSARRLAHPNIVRIHDMGESRGRKFISMEFIDGIDLRGYLRTLKQRLTLAEVHGIIYPVALAMDYAHSNQIVHRDIKPANIMITREGVVKVSDFGIAKILESASETMIGAVVGTPLYMSPEQIQGKLVDHRTDIYALGIMMYELICGRPPFFEGDLAYQHVHVSPPPISGLPEDVWAIIVKALAKDREERFVSAGEMARQMEASPHLGRAVSGR